ncbi:hypothetical protein GQR58_029163 [Nymphon striatum]|nr:hypothetical protein GQR58_029163 [Nymphon striatum]
MTNDRSVSVSRLIDAPADAIFDVLANPSRHAEIDGSGTLRSSKDRDPERLELGSKFSMKMKILVPYGMSSTVVEFEENKLITWAHFGKHRWRYELEEVEGGTMVTETFDWSTALFPPAIEWMGYPKKHPAAMEKTLEHEYGFVCLGLQPPVTPTKRLGYLYCGVRHRLVEYDNVGGLVDQRVEVFLRRSGPTSRRVGERKHSNEAHARSKSGLGGQGLGAELQSGQHHDLVVHACFGNKDVLHRSP